MQGPPSSTKEDWDRRRVPNRIAGPVLAVFLFLCAQTAAAQADHPLWRTYESNLKQAKYIDLTHAFHPRQPIWTGFGEPVFGPARAAIDVPGFIKAGEAFAFERHGFVASAYTLPTDQLGTQLDPPAHFHALGATISDLPATIAIRPLAVIDVSAKAAADPGYHLTVADVLAWETRHGRIPEGSVVFVRSDWSKLWNDPTRFAAKPHPGVGLDALKFLHLDRNILMHGHEPLDTDTSPNLEGEAWLLRHDFAQAEGVANLDLVPEAGALVTIGFAKPLGGTGGLARYIAIAPPDWPHGASINEAPGAPLPRQKAPLARGVDGVLRPAP